MKRLALGLAVPLVFLFATATAFCDDWAVEIGTDGNKLIVACKSAVQNLDDPSQEFTIQQAHNAGFCLGFVYGIADSVQADADLSGTSRGQLIRVVQKYLEDHPEQLSKSSSWLVRQALIRAFPKTRGPK
jgi:hypothetical protein